MNNLKSDKSVPGRQPVQKSKGVRRRKGEEGKKKKCVFKCTSLRADAISDN